MIKINIKDSDILEKVLKKFKRKVEQSTILKELKKREFYLKPSIKKKIKSRIALARVRKKNRYNIKSI